MHRNILPSIMEPPVRKYAGNKKKLYIASPSTETDPGRWLRIGDQEDTGLGDSRIYRMKPLQLEKETEDEHNTDHWGGISVIPGFNYRKSNRKELAHEDD